VRLPRSVSLSAATISRSRFVDMGALSHCHGPWPGLPTLGRRRMCGWRGCWRASTRSMRCCKSANADFNAVLLWPSPGADVAGLGLHTGADSEEATQRLRESPHRTLRRQYNELLRRSADSRMRPS
jgi:hypothetical protein